MPLAAGIKLGSYELATSIGAGGMGEVYRAHDRRLGRDVAVKVIPACSPGDATRVRRFEQEARAAAAINHPNILAVYDIGTHGWPEGAWFGMTRRRARLALRLATYACMVIAFLYGCARGFLFYDARRAATMLDELGRVRIGDRDSSVQPLLHRYGGYKWTPRNEEDEFGYVVEVNPWRFANLTGHTRRFGDTIRRMADLLPENFRRSIGLRTWLVSGELSMQNGHVRVVSAEVIVEGRHEWLGSNLAGQINDYDLSVIARGYVLLESEILSVGREAYVTQPAAVRRCVDGFVYRGTAASCCAVLAPLPPVHGQWQARSRQASNRRTVVH